MWRFRFVAVMAVVVLVVAACSGLGALFLRASPSAVMLVGDVGGAPPSAESVTLRNAGLSTVDYEIVSDRAWLTVTPTSGSLASNAQATLNVSVAACVAVGVEEGSLSVTSGGYAAEIDVTRACLDPNVPPLAVDRVYVNQAVPAQDTALAASDRVALVANRGGLLRVFVTADMAGVTSAQVRFNYRIGGGPESSVPVPGPSSVLTTSDEGSPSTTYNVVLPSSVIQPDLQAYLTVSASIGARHVSVRYPGSGWWDMAVETVPAADFTVVPVTYGGTTPTVGSGEAYFEFTRRVYPLGDSSVDIQVRATPYVYGGSLATNQASVALLTQLTTLRTSDGSGRHYVGIVNRGRDPFGGIGWLGGDDPVVASHHQLPQAPETVAHELGHNWARDHAPCGAVDGFDQAFPYADGIIGSWGYDLTTAEHKSPSTFNDLMGYCPHNRWISDYTYEGVMAARKTLGFGVVGLDDRAGRAPLLVVSGWTDGGDRLELDPLVVLTGVAKPIEVGPFTLVAWDTGGREVLRVAFGMQPLSVHELEAFHLTIPLRGGELPPLGRVAIERDGVVLVERTPPVRASAALATTVTRDADGGATVRWDAGSFPSVLVRDGVDGPLLGQGAGGEMRVWPSGGVLELLFSDGLNTRSAVVEF